MVFIDWKSCFEYNFKGIIRIYNSTILKKLDKKSEYKYRKVFFDRHIISKK